MEDLRERVEAVERALTEGESDLTALAEGAARAERVDALAADVEALQNDVTELRTATQALRGYVGNIRSVNESVEERADGALAVAESLEDRVEALEDAGPPSPNRDGGRGRDESDPTASERGGNTRRDRGAADGRCQACGRPDPDGRSETEMPENTGPDFGSHRDRLEARRSDHSQSRTSPRPFDRTDGPADPDSSLEARSDRNGAPRPPNRSPGSDNTDRWDDGDDASLLGSIRDRL